MLVNSDLVKKIEWKKSEILPSLMGKKYLGKSYTNFNFFGPIVDGHLVSSTRSSAKSINSYSITLPTAEIVSGKNA